MLKSIIAIVASYALLLIVFMAVFTGCYFTLGPERVFKPDSYEISTLWLVLTLAGSFLVSILAGYVCAAISKSWRTCQVFALLVFVLTLLSCVSALKPNPDAPNVRAGEVAYLDALHLAVSPFWFHLVNPVLSGAAVLFGARRKIRVTP